MHIVHRIQLNTPSGTSCRDVVSIPNVPTDTAVPTSTWRSAVSQSDGDSSRDSSGPHYSGTLAGYSEHSLWYLLKRCVDSRYADGYGGANVDLALSGVTK